MKHAYLGIDIGSISTKGVIIDEDNRFLASEYIWTEGQPYRSGTPPAETAGAAVRQGALHCGVRRHHRQRRRLIGAVVGASMVKNEITAHAVGTTTLHPNVRTIFEIGGQDSKIILLENGVVVDYAMNTLCAASTGSFLSSQSHRLGVEVEEFGHIALKSKTPTPIAARCTVFAESDLVHKAQMGYSREDIIAGLCKAVVTNYLNNVGKGKRIQSPIVFQGGVSKNVGVVRFFKEATGEDILVDDARPFDGRFRRGNFGSQQRRGKAFRFQRHRRSLPDPGDPLRQVRQPM